MSLLREAERCLGNFQKFNKSLNAFTNGAWNERLLLDRVKESDIRCESGNSRSPIEGRLVAIKDNICTFDYPTTCASGILKGFNSPFDATVVKRLRDSGALVVGKTNLDEFGMGSHSTHSRFGAVKHLRTGPNGERLSPGGSSGGSAVAVASGQCYAALGTDTGGSVRLPASYCGVVGFKPSYGLVSRWGVVAYANSLDTVGVLAKDSRTAKDVHNIIDGYDSQDPTSVPISTRTRIAGLRARRQKNTPFRIGVPIEYNVEELSPVIRQVWVRTLQHLKHVGHEIYPVSLPATQQALSAYYVLAPAEASSNLARYDGVRYGSRNGADDAVGGVLYAGTRGQGFGDEVKRRILLGAYSLSAEAMNNYFIQAQRVRRLVQQDFNSAFSLPNALSPPSDSDPAPEETGRARSSPTVDVLLCPTAPTPPPTLESLSGKSPLEAYVNDVFTVPASLAGLPAISLPVKFSGEGADTCGVDSVGMQIIAQYGDDELVFDVAKVIEEWGRVC
ncbi:MAG: Trimeric GatFAB AmidoTransferase(AdT) complex subunit [Geoglossum simile]|nr:MAG: Trimeric GatFAB AmidoTransferase(AdT) complex subunit [Geoglossum simile]